MLHYSKTLILYSVFLLSTQACASLDQDLPESAPELTAEKTSRVIVEWIEPKTFRDVKHPSMSSKRYREQVFSDLETFLASLGERLPDDQVLTIKVTNLDMAGTVETPSMAGLTRFSSHSFSAMNEYRIIRNIDIPRITFSYQLMDNNKQIIQQEEVKLKDMSFLSRAHSIRKNTSLRYEKAMISKWFSETFIAEG